MWEMGYGWEQLIFCSVDTYHTKVLKGMKQTLAGHQGDEQTVKSGDSFLHHNDAGRHDYSGFIFNVKCYSSCSNSIFRLQISFHDIPKFELKYSIY